jgi:prepilin-type processing-associated H-X9-DG protein
VDQKYVPNIDAMAQRAAIWDYALNWNLGANAIKSPMTHANGTNVAYYDGHVRFVRDEGMAKMFSFTYFGGSGGYDGGPIDGYAEYLDKLP